MVQKTLTWNRIRAKLEHLSNSELIDILSGCYNIDEDVEQFLTLIFDEDGTFSARIMDERKRQIVNALWTFNRYDNPASPDIEKAKRIVMRTERLTDDPVFIAEIMLFFIECGVKYFKEYGDMWQEYYDHIVAVFERLAEHIIANFAAFEPDNILQRLNKLVGSNRNVGWGFSIRIKKIYDAKIKPFEGQSTLNFL